ncbi:hypothetical protein NL108_011967, partial [Boleophthalmus pectinirostris]
EFMEMAKSLESLRRRCFTAESELKKYKELLVKSDVAKAALEVKLKHVRNQLDLEMQKRLRVERDFQYLQRQMQLMCDILVQDSKSSSCLNEEQKSLLATFEHKNQASTIHKASKRLSVIDESSFLSHSDISYDRTDDDVDLDSTVIKPLKSRAREKRRSSMGVVSAANGPVGKRVRTSISTEIQTHIQDRMNLNKVQLSSDTMSCTEVLFSLCLFCYSGSVMVYLYWFNLSVRCFKFLLLVYLLLKVIRPETCYCCGKRMRFGKMVVKCRNCRVVVHPECKNKCPVGCSSIRPSPLGPQTKAGTQIKPGSLESFCPTERPRVPLLVVECISEIERRGLKERGLYRVPGGDRAVKELRERFLSGKTALNLGKVEDVHVICCLLKDFLRKLPEPLITFRLHKLFMETAEIEDERGTVILYKAISELPPPNKDTLAIILLHLH